VFQGFDDGRANLRLQLFLTQVLAAGRRLLSLLTWFAVIAMVAGVSAYWRLTDESSVLKTQLIAVVFLGPPLVLLHFVLVLRLIRFRIGLFTPARWFRVLLTSRWLAASMLLQPWYWGLLLVSFLASLAIVPFAVILAVF
jgi:hypothetical protein